MSLQHVALTFQGGRAPEGHWVGGIVHRSLELVGLVQERNLGCRTIGESLDVGLDGRVVDLDSQSVGFPAEQFAQHDVLVNAQWLSEAGADSEVILSLEAGVPVDGRSKRGEKIGGQLSSFFELIDLRSRNGLSINRGGSRLAFHGPTDDSGDDSEEAASDNRGHGSVDHHALARTHADFCQIGGPGFPGSGLSG